MSTNSTLPRMPVVDRFAFLLDAVRGKNILSVGLGGYADARNYSFQFATADLQQTLSARLAAAAQRATFVDLSQEAIDAFGPAVSADYYRVDITAEFAQWPAALTERRFDAVILGEVLEHLDNPGQALRNLARLVSAGGQLVITVPNAYSLPGIVKMLGRVENTHPEHTCHYSYLTLTRLLAMNGFMDSRLLWYRWPLPASGGRWLRLAAAALMRPLPQFSHGIIAVVPCKEVKVVE